MSILSDLATKTLSNTNTTDTSRTPNTNILAGLMVKQPVFEKEERHLTSEEYFSAQELGYSPSEYRRYQAGEKILKPIKDSTHWQDQKQYEEEWRKEEERANQVSLLKESAEILEAKENQIAEIKAIEQEKQDKKNKERAVQEAQAELEAVKNKPSRGLGMEFPPSRPSKPTVIGGTWGEDEPKKPKITTGNY